MASPRITIVTPSYNQAEYIEETIESILSQGYPNLEYIIIDGGSTDGSVDIIKEHEQHLAYWVSEKDRGQSHAITKGFEKCTGDLFAWVNSDDVLFPGCLEAIAERYVRGNKPDIIHANVAYIDSCGRVMRFVRIPPQSRFLFSRGIWYAQAPVVFFKSSLFRSVGGVNEHFYQAMDFDVWMRLMSAGAIVAHIPQYLGGFRWHEQSKSHASFLAPAAKRAHPEDTEVLEAYLSPSKLVTRFLWQRVYKVYRCISLRYLHASLDLRRLGVPTHWKEMVL